MESIERGQNGAPLNQLVTLAREQSGQFALLVMSLIGLGISIYLTIVHYDSKVSLVCTTGGVVNCQSVTSSAYSVVPGTNIPITIPGMLWFVALGALAGVGLWATAHAQAEPPRLRLATLLWTIAGLVFVLYLVFAEIVKLQRICEWCTVVHLLTLGAFLIALTRWQRRDEPIQPLTTRARARGATVHHQATTRVGATPARHSSAALSRRARRSVSQRPPAAR
ncbi:MAG TPA: vitamin K epoxide reductase family protein [Ktedonobacterales bacterium]